MKKNISINISGIIFHIEEDAYETLKKYLDSVTAYFSSYQDNSEILADIENRIAEIFTSKLDETKQVITAEDVNVLISTMGNIRDFAAAEEGDFTNHGTKAGGSSTESTPPKEMLRDEKRKILGGVCAGLGSYLNVDPVWIRLLFALFAFVFGITIAIYIIMWIAMPGSYELEEPVLGKKMFRDPDRKVLGGVSSGLASYFNSDVVVFRVLFIVFTLAGGLGLLIYAVLWGSLPEAKSLTDKMQMQGEPVTLSNIDSNIRNRASGEAGKNNGFEEVITAPFKILGLLLTGLSKLIAPVFEIIRIVIGAAFSLMGFVMIVTLIIAGGILFGIFSGVSFPLWMELPSNDLMPVFFHSFPRMLIAAVFVVLFIPFLFLMLLGISIIASRYVVGAVLGWMLFVFFLAGIIFIGINLPGTVRSFRQEGEYRVEKTFVPNKEKVYFKIRFVEKDSYDGLYLSIKGHDKNEIRVVEDFKSQGKTYQDASANAQMVSYGVEYSDSLFVLDNTIQFKDNAIFRGQHLDLTFYMPYDYPFVMNEDICWHISSYIDWENTQNETWKITRENGLECITCTNSDF